MRVFTKYGACELTPLPGCAQVVVSHNAFVRPGYRGVGAGTTRHTEMLAAIERMHYDYALCTVQSTNMAQQAILEKHGWKCLDWFESSYTGHRVLLYGRHTNRSG